MPRLTRLFAAVAMALSASACVTTLERTEFTAAEQAEAQVPGFEDIRIWSDAPAEQWRGWRARFLAERKAHGFTAPPEILAISSGADKGAFSAGLLGGWSEAGTRPDFDIVSGVSTGALIAPFAFLGPPYDGLIEELYTTIDADAVFRPTPVSGILGGPSLATTKPLEKLIEDNASDALIDAIAAEEAKGRRLLVQTTNLDAERGMVWDMTAIAASESAQRYRLFRKILLASSSIPGFFPPILIDVEGLRGSFAELHVDGGATSSVLAVPLSVILSREDEAGEQFADARLTILYNGALNPVFRVSEPTTFDILRRALTATIKTADRRSIETLKAYARDNGGTLRIFSIGPEGQDPEADLFEPEFMQKLFDLGYERGRALGPGASS